MNFAFQVENLPLKILPSGVPVHSASELFAGPRMRALLRTFAATNAIVILDTSPVLATNEPAVLARLVGHTVFVVHASESTLTVIERSLDLIGQQNNVSILLNKGFALGHSDQFGSYYNSYVQK